MFSVFRLTPFEPVDEVFGGRGKFAAVPGDPALRADPVLSSVFCELSMTDLLGSTVSSLCSPLVKSQSTETPARNLSEPRSGSSVALIFASRSDSIFWRYSRLASEGCEASSVEALRARLRSAPRLSTRVTDSGESPSTALATRLTIAFTFWPDSLEPGLRC